MVSIHQVTLALLASLSAALTCPCVAAEPGDAAVSSLRLSGFGTFGVTHSHSAQDFGFKREVSQPSFESGTRLDVDSRLGLQANYTINPQFELVGQILLKRRIAGSPPADSLEWAFASYRPAPDWVVRAGRVAPDVFLLSDYRSVGFAYPWVRPNVDVYAGLPVFSIEGVDVSKTWNIGDMRWRGRVFGGQGHTRTPPSDDQPNQNNRFRELWLGSLSGESGGLTARVSAARLRLDLGDQPWKRTLRDALAQIAALPVPSIAAEADRLSEGLGPNSAVATYFALGASYDGGDWLASAEAVRLRSDMSFASSDSGYLSVGRRIGPVTLFGMAGAARTPVSAADTPQWAAQLAPILGPTAAAGIQAVGSGAAEAIGLGRVDQRSISGGMRWDVHPQVALKLQWDHFIVRRNGSLYWGNRSVEPTTANVVTASLDFVF